MVWITKHVAEAKFLIELKTYPDRVVGLLAPAILDSRIEAVIKSRWHNTSDGKLFGELFRDGAQLGNLVTRIQVGFAIGLYDEDAYSDLRNIARIRNEFAHKLEADDFNYQSIRDRTRNLRLPDKHPVTIRSESFIAEQTPVPRSEKDSLLEGTLKRSILRKLSDPRTRFLRAVEILVIKLWYIEREDDASPTPEPLGLYLEIKSLKGKKEKKNTT